MKTAKYVLVSVLGLIALVAPAARADSFSFTGALSNPTDVFETTLLLPAVQDVTLQTYGFGGGTNAAGATISPGGTDPFVAIFSGVGPGATILTDGTPPPGPNPFGTSLDLTNYASFSGCPLASAPTIGGSAQCGDVAMTLPSLAAGLYTVVLSDGQYQANAVFDNGTLGEGFVDFTGGQFCNILINGVACPANSPTLTNPQGNGAFALDILTSGSAQVNPVPEPGTLLLFGSGLFAVGWRRSWIPYRRRRFAPGADRI